MKFIQFAIFVLANVVKCHKQFVQCHSISHFYEIIICYSNSISNMNDKPGPEAARNRCDFNLVTTPYAVQQFYSIEAFHLGGMGKFRELNKCHLSEGLKIWMICKTSSSSNKHLLGKGGCPAETKGRDSLTAISCKQCRAPQSVLLGVLTHDDLGLFCDTAVFESSLFIGSNFT